MHRWIQKYFHRLIRSIAKVSIMLALAMLLCASEDVFAAQEQLSGTIHVMMHESKEVVNSVNEAFMRKYPNVKVEYEALNDYENTIAQKISEGDFGDVVFLPSYLDSETLQREFEPLGTVVELSEKYNYIDRSARTDNEVYGIPYSAYLSGILYNKDLFNRAGISERPRSIEEFYQDMCLIKDATGAVPFCSYYSTDWALYNWANFPYIEMTGNPGYKEHEFLYERNPFTESGTHYQVYKLLYDLIADGLTEQPLGSISWNQSMQMLKDGKLGCVVLGSWSIHQLLRMKVEPDSIGFMPFPNEIDGEQYMTVLTDFCIGVNRNSQNKQAALAYVDFFLNESGYAIQQDRISIVKTDIFPESYADLVDAKCIVQGSYDAKNYEYYMNLVQGVDPGNISEIKRIMEAAAGISNESFDEIMQDWNTRWENARPDKMKQKEESKSSGEEEKATNQINVADNGKAELSDLERNYIQEHPVIKIGYLTHMAPFQYMDENGEFQGLASDIIDYILERTGFTAEYYPYSNTQEMIYALNEEKIDIAAGIENVKENSGRVNFSKSYISYSDVIVNLNSIDQNQLKTQKQVILTGETNKTDYIKAQEYLEAENILSGLQMISTKQADFAITNCYTAEYYLNELNNAKLATIPISGERNLCLAFAKKSQFQLISICNKCIYNLPDSSLQMQMLRYLNNHSQKITLARIIREYPLQSVLFLILLFSIIGIAALIFYMEQRKHMEKHSIEMKRYEILSHLMDEYIFDYDVKDNSILLDQKFRKLCGCFGHQNLSEYKKDNVLLNTILEHCIKVENDTYVSEPFRFTNQYNQTLWYRMTIFRIEEKGVTHQLHLIGKIVNIQQEIEAQMLIQNQADTDALTGLYNRSGFEKKFISFFEEEKYRNGLAFAILDLDDFKGVNDILGHDGGDEAIKQLTNELNRIERENIILARYGGDEFIICAFDISMSDAEAMFKDLVKRMDRNMEYNTQQKHISISLGAVYTNERVAYADLFTAADQILYSVKSNGKNGYAFRDAPSVLRSGDCHKERPLA